MKSATRILVGSAAVAVLLSGCASMEGPSGSASVGASKLAAARSREIAAQAGKSPWFSDDWSLQFDGMQWVEAPF